MAAPKTYTSLVLDSATQPVRLKLTTNETPTSPPPSGTALLRVLAAPVQPHAADIYSGQVSHLQFPTPMVPGHVAVARVLAPLPPDATRLREGSLVFVDSLVHGRDAPDDAAIMLGMHHGNTPEENGMFANAWRNGTWREVMTAPLENCHLVDEQSVARLGLRPADLLYLSRLFVAKGAARAAKLAAGKIVAVGPATGQFSGAMVELASAMGCRVVALGRNEARLKKIVGSIPRVDMVVVTGDAAKDEAAIRALLPDGSPGIDAFIEFSPALPETPAHVAPAIAAVRPRGHIALLGTLFQLEINNLSIMFRNITIKGQYMYDREDVTSVINMVELGVIKLGKAAGHVIGFEKKLEDWETALKEAPKFDDWGQLTVFTMADD